MYIEKYYNLLENIKFLASRNEKVGLFMQTLKFGI